MIETEVEPALAPMLRRLRGLIADAPITTTCEAEPPAASAWRDDLRWFISAWAAGFLFFMVLIA